MIKSAAEICPECGVRVSEPASDAGDSDKDRTTAAIFALILGGLGAHKFYLGETGWGVLYLVFCWTFIPMLLGLVEGIIYLTKSDEEFQRKYVN
ncbi:TM2 domain-containing protein [Halomarina rubra]|uniref:TM2 domain-containing protein n=1 Tax=Halomarina rubra TaxID=2071873 RepID=A0ABD6ASP4_9EURY